MFAPNPNTLGSGRVQKSSIELCGAVELCDDHPRLGLEGAPWTYHTCERQRDVWATTDPTAVWRRIVHTTASQQRRRCQLSPDCAPLLPLTLPSHPPVSHCRRFGPVRAGALWQWPSCSAQRKKPTMCVCVRAPCVCHVGPAMRQHGVEPQR